mgnify:CR=1 FL=1
MATKYLLPCSCGKSIHVDINQAGDTAPCECGKLLEVPSMRELRELQPVPDDKAFQNKGKQWTKRESVVFAFGLVIIIIGLGIAGYFQIGRLGLDTTEVRYDNLEESLQKIDDMNVAEQWDTWLGVKKIGMGPHSTPQVVVNRYVASKWLLIIWGGIGLACKGMFFCAVAFAIRRPL